ncbi:tyrosine-type recombinase/integrase [Caulobacter hibisci]|uniref:Integrase arm-type DNA-binding domain-containing protein n=1 Tax=Caulobacter hibisci TaxID=2035993 RepID=A0ABS0T1D5_9CAUL|nr:site-specific integrase [Caulobacter hibisci]MBI1684930.1 integrase arm-type DNA-binding domain-containing protein [Caulobacter hibisci]
MSGRSLHKLTALQAAKLSRPGRHSDGGGLYLSIDEGGRRRWVFMHTRAGRRVELGLGGRRDLTLADARAEAATFRAMLAAGTDPKAERVKDDTTQTFGNCADAYVEAMSPSWRNAKHAAQWKMTLTKYAAAIRERPVNEVTTQDVLDVLQPLWTRTPETAERLRGRIENVLDAAKARGLRSGENPARWRGHLNQLLPKRQRLTRGHHAALPYDAVPEFMANLGTRGAVAARALEFLILTGARSGELLGASWDEINLEKEIWTVPADRMKAGREHRIPLSSCAMKILAERLEVSSIGYIFPGATPKSPLSSMAMAMLLRRMKSDITVHGFRSTFRDWASEMTTFSHEVCEMALAHTIANKAEAAYRRGDLFEKRRKLMEAWASYCSSGVKGKVVMLRPS